MSHDPPLHLRNGVPVGGDGGHAIEEDDDPDQRGKQQPGGVVGSPGKVQTDLLSKVASGGGEEGRKGEGRERGMEGGGKREREERSGGEGRGGERSGGEEEGEREGRGGEREREERRGGEGRDREEGRRGKGEGRRGAGMAGEGRGREGRGGKGKRREAGVRLDCVGNLWLYLPLTGCC